MLRCAALAAFAIAAGQPASAQQGEGGDCLFADAPAVPPAGCRSDPDGVASQPLIVRTVEGLGLRRDQVQFQGCTGGRFSTSVLSRSPLAFRINYPDEASFSFVRFVGPLAHEFGHVAQLEGVGSIRELRHSLRDDSARVELGADFLAGFIYQRVMHNPDQLGFERSLDLLGNYERGRLATHSRPEARTSAFRMGFNYSHANASAAEAHRDFQDNLYAEIMEMLS